MEKELITTIIKAIKKEITEEKTEIENKYKKIENCKEKKIAYIDGGQATIIKTVNLELQYTRIIAVIYQGTKKEIKRKEFYTLITNEQEEIKTNSFGQFENIKINAYNENLQEGKDRIELNKIGGVIRRLAELQMAQEIETEIICLDGSLKTKIKQEKEKMEQLKKTTKKITALAKTTTELTKGKSLITTLANENKQGTWYYPINNEKAIVKLNNKTKYLFEINAEQKVQYNEFLGLLKEAAKDPIFPGYPYGLILADKLARISNDEKNRKKTLIMAKFGPEWEKIKNATNILNSHDILDNIS